MPDSDITLCWSIDHDQKSIAIRMTHPNSVWISIGIGNAMSNSDAIIGRLDNKQVIDAYIKGRTIDSIEIDHQQDTYDSDIFVSDGYTILEFKRQLDTGDSLDKALNIHSNTPIIWAVGSGTNFNQHLEFGMTKLNLGNGSFTAAGHSYLIILHAILMVAAWGVLAPIAILIARFFKVTKSQDYPNELDNKFWWHFHWAGQIIAIAAATIALALAYFSIGGIDLSKWHSKIGIAVMAIGWTQVALGYFRGTKGGPTDNNGVPVLPENMGGDHWDMSTHRILFEFAHKKLGYIAILMAFFAILTGFFQLKLGYGYYMVYLGFVLILYILFNKFELEGRWVDTYHAIWGENPDYPGNKRLALLEKRRLSRKHKIRKLLTRLKSK
ncbi:MAG: cytochrome and DOMON domain-containing protein [Arenicella sp.]